MAKIDDIYGADLSLQRTDNPGNGLFHLSLCSYPNPFSTGMTVFYSIGELSGKSEHAVKVAIYDILGNEIKTLVSGNQAPGKYQVYWNGLNNKGLQCVNSVYFCNIAAENNELTQKLILGR